MLDERLGVLDRSTQVDDGEKHAGQGEQVEEPAALGRISDRTHGDERNRQRHRAEATAEVDGEIARAVRVPAEALGPPDRVDEERQREHRYEDRGDDDQEEPGAVHQAGKTAMVAVKPCRKLCPPTGPISPAQKKPAVGTPRESSSAAASW